MLVAAPSKLLRPSGDRVKTDARDAAHLARLLHLGQIVAVTIPSASQEAARDLVRAREDCRGDLMSARHRVSKLLLRQGIIYSGGKTWTGKHEAVAARPAVRQPGPAAGLRHRPGHHAGEVWIAVTASMPRSRSWPPTARSRRWCTRLGCLRGYLDVDCVRAGGRDRRLGPVDRTLDRRLPRVGAHRVLLRSHSRSQGAITKTGNGHARRLLIEAAWHHRQPVSARSGSAAALGCGRTGRPGPGPAGQPAPAHPLGRLRCPPETSGDRQHRDRPRTGRLVLVTGRHARLT